jgi:hypothetical protein
VNADCVTVCVKLVERLQNIGLLGPEYVHQDVMDALDSVEIIRMGRYVPQNNVKPLEE